MVLEILTLPANKIKRNIKKISHDFFWKLTGHQGIDIYVGLLKCPEYFGMPFATAISHIPSSENFMSTEQDVPHSDIHIKATDSPSRRPCPSQPLPPTIPAGKPSLLAARCLHNVMRLTLLDTQGRIAYSLTSKN
jgi:hypothetical protein